MEKFEQQKESEKLEVISGTVKKRINKGKAKKQQTNEQPLEDCSICYGEIIDKGIIQTCKHTYCFSCIEVWAKQNQTCPQCRVRFNRVQKVWKQGKVKRQKMYYYPSYGMNIRYNLLINLNQDELNQDELNQNEQINFYQGLEQRMGFHFMNMDLMEQQLEFSQFSSLSQE